MGIFDEISFNCPKCDNIIIEQSKAGDCTLRTYSSDEVPVNIANSIIGGILWCEKCNKSYTIVPAPTRIKTIKLGLIE